MTPELATSLRALAPEGLLVAGALLLILRDLWRPVRLGGATGFGVLLALGALGLTAGAPFAGSAFSGQVDIDGLAVAGRVLVFSVLLATLLTARAAAPVETGPAEWVALLLFATAGLSGVAASRHWLVLFIFLEMSSFSVATLLGSRPSSHASREASLKYFILSAFASAFLLYGIALLFFTTGTFAVGLPSGWGPAERLAIFFILAGLAFKGALVPFHMWAPDVYQGGPTPVAGFLAAASKTIGFLVLARLFLEGGAVVAHGARAALAAMAALSMTVGTLLALVQRDVKRMLAFSGIAHAGYAALALVAGGPAAVDALLIYLFTYAAMTFAAFAALAAVEGAGLGTDLKSLAGLGRRSPALGLALAVAMVSLTGLPPTAGFVAKFGVFREAVAAGQLWLVLVAVAMSVVSVGFYLRVLIPVWMEPAEPGAEPLAAGPEGAVVAGVLALGLVVAGLFPDAVVTFASTLAAH